MSDVNVKAKFGASLRDVLWDAQNGECWMCKRRMHRRGSNDPASVSIDHIWPKALYGQLGDIGITLLACRGCNAGRGSPKPLDSDIRTLVRIWKRVDPRWLKWTLQMVEDDLRALEMRRARVELLRMLVAA